MRRIPNFALLKTFEAAARLENFTLAALELHVTQSAVSHQVRKLEEYFGRALFIRQNRRVQLTAEGKRLLESLSRVFDAMETACAEVALAPQAQVLALHCSPSLASKWLSPRLPEFMQAHPDIIIRLTSGAEPIDLTRTRELDLLISYGAVRERAGIISMPLGTERIAPMCSPALIHLDVAMADLLNRLTLIDSQLSPVTWADWFSSNGLELPNSPRPSYDRASLAISAAVDGLGVILESTRLARLELENGKLLELGQDTFPPCCREIHFVSYRANENQVPKIKKFRHWLLMKSAD
ncbi:LysR family transcriptional regulator [Pusillimonas harenae]|uniref:LysR family transcriptional regulator n=2 Tax=Pollutimonas harenae TaxID=657015 RepID=A0A853GT49_9BURK|nr:LysR family transcriptional regulator [Pollutimonas harenae]